MRATRSVLPAVPRPGAISVRDPSSLDFEASPRLRLVVQAETAASLGFMAVTLLLQDANDNAPRFQLLHYVAFLRESQSYHLPLIQVRARAGHPWLRRAWAALGGLCGAPRLPCWTSPGLHRCWQMTRTREPMGK